MAHEERHVAASAAAASASTAAGLPTQEHSVHRVLSNCRLADQDQRAMLTGMVFGVGPTRVAVDGDH